MRADSKVILFKTETVYGTDALPAAVDAILTNNWQLQPLVGDRRSRELDRKNLGASPQYIVGTHNECSFRVELAGAGTVDTPPKYARLLRACGFAETVTAATDVQFDPLTADGDSGSLYFNLDGRLHKLPGGRGAVGFSFVAGDIPQLVFNNFRGLLVAASDTPAVTGDYSAFQEPLQVNKQNTPTFTIHGHAGVLRELTIEPGQQVNHRNWVNQEAVRISGRNYVGRLSMLTPTLATFDYEDAIRNRTLGLLQIVHGTAAGNTVQLDGPRVQILGYADGEDQGDAILTLDLLFTASDAGDDEIKLTTR